MKAGTEHAPPLSARDPPFVLFYEQEKSFVWNLVRRFGVPAQDREDVFHEIFVRALRQPHILQQPGSPRPWLTGVAFRVVSEWRRSRGRHATLSQEPLAEPVDVSPSPEQAYGDQQSLALVEAALQCVELGRRAVFVAVELEGAPVTEIAAALDLPLNTAYSRLRLAREEFAAAVRRLQARGVRR